MTESRPAIIYEDGTFALQPSAECSIPGYVVLRLKGPETSLAELSPENAKALGEMLARTAAAIEQAAGAERVYVLSFCEVDPRLHFHLFPRTAWLLREYLKANDCANAPVSGPMLFEWSRGAFGPDSCLPDGIPDFETVCVTLREILK